jgi:hypothetical protein
VVVDGGPGVVADVDAWVQGCGGAGGYARCCSHRGVLAEDAVGAHVVCYCRRGGYVGGSQRGLEDVELVYASNGIFLVLATLLTGACSLVAMVFIVVEGILFRMYDLDLRTMCDELSKMIIRK